MSYSASLDICISDLRSGVKHNLTQPRHFLRLGEKCLRCGHRGEYEGASCLTYRRMSYRIVLQIIGAAPITECVLFCCGWRECPIVVRGGKRWGQLSTLGCARPKKFFKKCLLHVQHPVHTKLAWHKRNLSLLNLDVIAMGFGLSLSRLFSKL